MTNIKRVVSVEIDEWQWTCGDGCCDDWGTDVFIDGKEVAVSYDVDADDIMAILNAVDVDCVITEKDTRYDNRVNEEDD